MADDQMVTEKVEAEDAESNKRKVDEQVTTTGKDESESKESPSKKTKVEDGEAKPVAGAAKTTTALGTDDGPYKLQEPPTENNQEQVSRINSPKMVLFGLFPTVKEEKLRPFLEAYGTIKECRMRRAFANLYAAVEYATTEEAQKAYLALNSAKLLGKSLMIQPQQQPGGQS